MASDNGIVKRGVVEDIATTRERTELELRKQKTEAAIRVLDLLVAGGRVFVLAQAKRTELDEMRARTQDDLQRLDAQTSAELEKLEKALDGERNKTEVLRIVADVAAKQSNIDPVLRDALAATLLKTFDIR